MIIRNFDSDLDYVDVMSWWESQGWPALPSSMLSNTGFIVETNDGIKLASNWIFPTNCPIWIMEWTVGNPDVEWTQRKEGLDYLINHSCQWAKNNGALKVFTMTKHARFIDKLQELNFIKTDDNMTHLIRSL